MLKKLIARILVVALLMQALPMQALAEVGDSLLVSPEELSRLVAQYAQGADGGDYHAGMAYSEHFSAYQLLGYLSELEGMKIEPLANTVEMLVNAVAKYRDSGPQQEITVGKLMTLDAFMFNLHAITDEVTACRDDLESAINYIKNNADCVWDKESFSLTKRAGISRRIKEAEADIERVRRTVSERHADWETGLENSEQAIRNDGTMDVQPSAANDGSYVTFTPRSSDKARGAARGGGWQLRDLYSELKPQESPKLYSFSAEELGLTRTPSLLERLSPVSTAYAAREQDATVTVIDDNQFALEARDENDNPIVGMIVRAIDADKMYEQGDKQFVEVATDQNGAAVFDIPGNFTFDELEQLNLYIEYPSGTGTLVRGASNDAGGDAQPGYKEAHLWNVAVKRGSSFAFHTGQTNDPYLVSTAFDSVDITTTAETFFHSALTEATHKLFVEVGNGDLSTGKVHLRYVSAMPAKDEDGNYIIDPSTVDPDDEERPNYVYPTLETDAVSLTEKEGRLVATLEGVFLRDFKPHETVTLIYEDALHDAPFEFTLNLKIEESQATDAPSYKGEMRWLDLDTSGINLSFPLGDDAKTKGGVQVGIDNPLNVPHASAIFTLDGNLFTLVGAEVPDFVTHGKWKNWPNTASTEFPEEPTANGEGPERPTQADPEHLPQKQITTANWFLSKTVTDFKDNWTALRNKDSLERKKKMGSFFNVTLEGDAFIFGAGNLQKLGKDGDDYYIGIYDASIGGGIKIGFSTEYYYQATLLFVGLSASLSISAVAETTWSDDIRWKSWSDYKVERPLFTGPKQTTITLYIKVQIEGFAGFGIKGLAEVSFHGYFYVACTLTWLIYERTTDMDADTFNKDDDPHIVVTIGWNAYIMAKLLFVKVRVDIVPKNWPNEWELYNNWKEEDGTPDTWKDKDDGTDAGTDSGADAANAVRATAEGRALPPPAANADDAASDTSADGEDVQRLEADPPAYNDDLVVDTTAPGVSPLIAGIQAKDSKVVYARISNGKTDKDAQVTTHTYAFFLHPTREDGPGGAYLQYVDLDAPEPTVYDFQSERIDDYRSTWSYRNPWGKEWDAPNYETGDFAFDVKSVADMLGKDENGNPINPGYSGVVCILTTPDYDEDSLVIGDETHTAQKPSGETEATMFVVTRSDEQTGKLSTNIYLWDTVTAKTEKRDAKSVSVPSMQCEGLSGGANFDNISYPGMKIAAGYLNDSFLLDYGSEFGANIYEAVVLLDPEEGDMDDNVTEAVRYRATAYDTVAFNNMFTNYEIFYAEEQQKNARFLNYLGQDDLELWDSVATKSAGGKDYTIGGRTAGYAVLPFDIDWSMGHYLWEQEDPIYNDMKYVQARDLGPLANWFELRTFENENADDDAQEKGVFYHLYEKDWVGWASESQNIYPAGWRYGNNYLPDGTLNNKELLKGYVDWEPMNDNIPGDGMNGKLLGRTGTSPKGVLLPWNATTASDEIFFLYSDDSGRAYLDSIRLSNGMMTDYGFAAPAADMGCVDTGKSVVFYWFTSHGALDLADGKKGANYSFNTMLYEKESGVLFAPVVSAYVNAPNSDLYSPFVTEKGTSYFVAQDPPPATDSGLYDPNAPVSLTFYKFDQKYTMGVEFLAASFADGAVRHGAYDDINISLRNNGNVPLSGFTMEVYNVTESGEEQLMETIVADLAKPENSTVTYTGLADGNARTESGEQVVSMTGSGTFRTRGEWAVVEATPNYPQSGGGNSPDALPTSWDTKETYLTTNSLMPKDQTSLTAPILIGADWKGVHKIRFRITQIVSSNDWAVDLEGNDLRQTRKALRAEQPRQVAVTRRSDGSSVVHYADQTPSDNPTWLRALLGAEEIEVPDNYNTDITFDDFELDTSSEDVTLHAREYTRPDGTQMVQLTAHNNAHSDGEDKCVVLYAYADYDQQNAWFVYDFGDLNAGSSVTLTLPLELILNGHTANTLLLDLHIDHETARRSGTSGLLQSHRHDGSGLLNGCQHDRIAMDDVVKISLGGAKPLQIDKQPVDQSILTGEEAAFSVDVTGGVLPYAFQWQVRKPLLGSDGKPLYDEQGNLKYGAWEDLPEGTGISLKLASSAEMNGWQFHVVVRDTVGSAVTSNFATLRLLDVIVSSDDVPKTGDDAHPLLWSLLALAALIAAMAVVGVPKRRRRGVER